jgi:hypothetical protein
VKDREKREIAWEDEHEVRVRNEKLRGKTSTKCECLHAISSFSPNFHKCFSKLYRNTKKMFSISFIKQPFENNRKDKCIDFNCFHSNINSTLIYVRVKNNYESIAK